MFLTGPFYFLSGNLQLELAGSETVEGRLCDLIVAVRRPGNGLSAEDRYLLYIDQENRLLRRVRFSLEGMESTQGAIAEIDFFDHREIAGVTWPTRFFERLRKPIPQPAGARLAANRAGGQSWLCCGRPQWRGLFRQGAGASQTN
jgi:hypothetical protein